MQPPAAAPQKLSSVQALRGLAALAVVLYHTHIILVQYGYPAAELFPHIARHGMLGVNLFFVLSGFIIWRTHRGQLGHRQALRPYLRRRALRIYPLYWLFLSAYLLAAAGGFGSPDFAWDLPNLIASYALLDPGGTLTLPLQVAWTLIYEIRFYLLFALFFWSVLLAVAVFALWGLAIILAQPLGLAAASSLLSPWNSYFLWGIAAALAVDRLSPRLAVAALALGLAVLWYVAQFNLTMAGLTARPELLFWLAPGFALIVIGLVRLEAIFGWVPPRALVLLGDASYAIYLAHSACLSALAIGLGALPWPILPTPLLFIAMAIASTAAGYAAHWFIERPLLARLGRPRPLTRQTPQWN